MQQGADQGKCDGVVYKGKEIEPRGNRWSRHQIGIKWRMRNMNSVASIIDSRR